MRLKAAFLFLLANLLLVVVARAAHTQLQLDLSAETAKPGDIIWAGVDLKMEPGWHTYWKNPGDAGQATEIKWRLPAGVTAGKIQWPLPEKLPPAEVTTYGYENEVVLLVPLTLASNLPAGALNLAAKVSWLECNESCIPASAEVQAVLHVGSENKTSAEAVVIESWKKQVPQVNAFYQLEAWWEAATNDTRAFVMSNWRGGADKNFKLDSLDFFPDASDNFEVQAATEIISDYSADIQIRKFVKKFSGDWPKEISGVLVLEANNSREGFEVKLRIGNQPPARKIISSTATQTPASSSQSLWQMLIFAFIGGLILNIMPCVLPESA